jgi:FlaA1/EpsC-like NDP-sugar epimerase
LEENSNFVEAIKTNIIGTLKVAEISEEYHCKRFVFISTDKAVRPTNLMGATKRISERLISTISASSNTIFSSVRFGNVLKSSGSVIPKFKDQIEKGGPVTVTHPEMTRYFMTIREAALLVISAGMMANTYDTYLLKMGNPVRIYDLAKKMINLYGFDVIEEGERKKGIEIIFTGLRSGEKTYEELLVSGNEKSTSNELIFRDECSSTLTEKEFELVNTELNTIIDFTDLKRFKELSKKFAEYGEEKVL